MVNSRKDNESCFRGLDKYSFEMNFENWAESFHSGMIEKELY
ncbi:hypothetical protein A3Q56_06679 [Intoshia linei]|uniref:Uncharacterized protein n=1 Tax=Intoshia linei TaxID=1819745 RepID=A0A177AU95_9BILA|nr:hypothetical protein A3Q56_06679 [Intoshia linei]